MTYPKELQDYYDAHDNMMDAERFRFYTIWPLFYGRYKIARHAAVKAGYLPEQPEFG